MSEFFFCPSDFTFWIRRRTWRRLQRSLGMWCKMLFLIIHFQVLTCLYDCSFLLFKNWYIPKRLVIRSFPVLLLFGHKHKDQKCCMYVLKFFFNNTHNQKVEIRKLESPGFDIKKLSRLRLDPFLMPQHPVFESFPISTFNKCGQYFENKQLLLRTIL